MDHKFFRIMMILALLTVCFTAAAASPLQQLDAFTQTRITKTENYANGDRYTGEFLNGKYDGNGVYTWANGDRYEGEFSAGQIDGAGRLTFANGLYWEGLFIFGQISNGSGCFYWGSSGDMFDGQWLNGKPEGTGYILHPNGTNEQAVYQNGVLVSSYGSSYSSGASGQSQWGSSGSSSGYSPFQNLQAGGTVTFGSYEQDNYYQNGKEPIVWKVLAINNGKALLLSQYLLEALPYNYSPVSVTWEGSTIRSWLNSSFYDDAFSAQEKAFIMQSWLTNPNNDRYLTNGGANTYDNVFLLSMDELRYYFPSEGMRKASPTAVARAHGAYGTADKNCAWWWLRSPGQNTACATSVNSIGVLLNTGPAVNDTTGGIRPAIWVNLGY